MSKPYTPLFNRTYLTVLVWFSAITVLILATQTGSGALPKLEKAEEHAIYWSSYEDAGNQLSLLIPTASAITDQDIAAQQLLQSQLEAKLATFAFTQGSGYELTLFPDYIDLRIYWDDADQAPDTLNLWQTLATPPNESLSNHLLSQVNAKRYLSIPSERRDASLTYLRGLFTQTNNAFNLASTGRYNDYLAAATAVFMGDDAEDMAEDFIDHNLFAKQEAEASSALSKRFPLRTSASLVSDVEENQGGDFRLITGSTLADRPSPEYMVDRLAVSTAQQALAAHQANTGLNYTLKYASLHDVGYFVMDLQSQYPVKGQLSAIANQVTDDKVALAKEGLVSSWLALSDSPSSLRNALNRVALYQLPLDTLKNLEDVINDADDDQIMQKAKILLTAK